MTAGIRILQPGETVIGFMTPDGKLIGQFADPGIGHDVLSYTNPNLRANLQSGQAIAITIGKANDGSIWAFGSGAFPPPGGVMTEAMRKLAVALVS
jgi:hypothetical protein